ncbi:hypothetical protein [Streptomyces sp. NPDC048361]|uniref:hypothetical protein n=1 Tax=Streptomyces sp. NPDC048361 TaxID=3154720 RepID=UPI0034168AF0
MPTWPAPSVGVVVIRALETVGLGLGEAWSPPPDEQALKVSAAAANRPNRAGAVRCRRGRRVPQVLPRLPAGRPGGRGRAVGRLGIRMDRNRACAAAGTLAAALAVAVKITVDVSPPAVQAARYAG